MKRPSTSGGPPPDCCADRTRSRLAKITAMADLVNTRSSRVMEKLGMRRDGLLRSERPSDADPGVRQDMVIYSVLREEWRSPARE